MADNDEYYFSPFKYGAQEKEQGTFIDPTVALANTHEMVVSFQHEPSGRSILFKAFIISFNETYSSDWVSEEVFGRTDPIQHFKQTTRRIALGLAIPAATYSEAFENLGKVGHLTQFLYPNYTNAGDSTTLSQNPFVRLKVMNLLRKITGVAGSGNGGNSSGGSQSNDNRYLSYTSTQDPNNGLLGAITSLSILHNLDNNEVGVLQKEGTPNTLFSKMIEINLDFVVVHETPLGWDGDGNFTVPLFPYGVNIESNYRKPEANNDKPSPEETNSNQSAEDQERAKLNAAMDWMRDYRALEADKARAGQAYQQALNALNAYSNVDHFSPDAYHRGKAAAEAKVARAEAAALGAHTRFNSRYGGDRSGHADRVQNYLDSADPRSGGGPSGLGGWIDPSQFID